MLEIYGIFENVYFFIEEVVLEVVKVFDVEVRFDDIEILYYFKGEVGVKFIIVKFVSYKKKVEFYK